MARPRGGPPEHLRTEPDGVLRVEAANIGPPRQVQIRLHARGAGGCRGRGGGAAWDATLPGRAWSRCRAGGLGDGALHPGAVGVAVPPSVGGLLGAELALGLVLGAGPEGEMAGQDR
jgi:hypothetical protein